MNSKNSLLIGRGIFTIILIVAFGLVIMNEKKGDLLKTKVSSKLNSYIETNYNDFNSFVKEEITYQNDIFTQKIISKKNKKLYFLIKYKNKEITDTYKKDYEEGNTLLTTLNNELSKEVQKQTKEECQVKNITTLDKYSEKIQERIIKEEELLSLKYYYISKELEITNWNAQEITKQIERFMNTIKEKEITPKYYEITITNKEDITTSIVISNITEEFLTSNNKEQIIKDILDNKNTNLVKESKITFQNNN